MDWDILNYLRATYFQGSIKNPDKQLPLSQISFYEADTWHYYRFNVSKEANKKKQVHVYDVDWDVLNHMRATYFQGSIKNPDKQLPFSQISLYEA